jgi:choice-of-anchor B domain-containing protein
MRHVSRFLLASLLALAGVLASAASAHDGDPKLLDRQPMYTGGGWRHAQRRGTDGNLALTAPGLRFPKSNVTLFAWLSLPDFGVPAGGNANSCYGYTSPSGREYAIVGLSTGTAFVEITQPGNPVIVQHINGPSSLWRDVRTYSTYCYSVSEGGGGIQVMNMANIDNGVVTLVGTVDDDSTHATHTLAINPASGYLYRSGGGSQGIRIYNLNGNPAVPARVGTWSARYSHEVSVFSFTTGPAAGKEIAYVCGGLNGGFSSTGVYVVDVTNKAAPIQLQYVTYPNAQFCHQCWPSPDMQYLYIDDELDDQNLGINSLTRVMSLANPLAPVYTGSFSNGGTATDHNQYTKGNLIYQANYRSGLRVKSTSNPGTPTSPVETAFFDTWPEDDTNAFNGLWNNYPYFPSGVVIGTDIEKGLFVWWIGTPQITISPVAPDPATFDPAGGGVVQVQISEIAPGTIVPGTELLHVRAGSGWVTSGLVPQGGGLYDAIFPAAGCGEPVQYYFTAASTNGIVWSGPEDAPAILHHAVYGSAVNVVASDDFESNSGWVAGAAGDTATAGIWTRVNPNGTEAQPEDDHTPGAGVACWVTGQGSVGGSASAADVDGGRTTLVSPVFDLGSLANPIVRYWRWYSNDWRADDVLNGGVHVMADTFRVDVSNNNGASWVNVETVGPSGLEVIGGWIFHQFRVSDYVLPTAQMKFRFVAEDANTGSIVEAAVDDFEIVDVQCGGIDSFCFGDGSGITSCPCNNNGASGHGCENSISTGGSILTPAGTASIASDTFVLTASGERPTSLSIFLQGDQEISEVPFGDGLRCTGGSLKRLYTKNASGGTVTAPAGADLSVSARSAATGDTIPGFGTRLYQVYYRDPSSSFCPAPSGSTFNVSNGLRVIWIP